MIDKIDENGELMIVLAEQLGHLAAFIGPKEHLPILLRPLELIANSDEAIVREKAVEAICKVAADLEKEQHTTELFPMVKRLAKGDTYMVKITATGIFPAVYPNVSSLNQTMLRQFYVDLCKDDTPMVRRAAAGNFPKFAAVIDTYFVKNEFVSVIQSMISDPQDSVKVAAVECAAKLISLLRNEEVSRILLPAMKSATEDKKSWRLRFTLAEATSTILEVIPKSLVDEFVVPWISALLLDTEPEVRSQALLELAGLSKYCTTQLLVDKILPTLNGALLKDPSEHVRASLAKTICGVGENLPQLKPEEEKPPNEPLETYVVPVCIGLAKDENIDVRLSLFQNVHLIIKALNNTQIDSHIIPLLNAVAADKQWRVRMEVVKYLPDLARKVDLSIFKEKLMKLFTNFLVDPAYQIREEATKSMPKLGELLGKEWLEEQILSKVNEFKASQDYLLRINSMLFITRLKDHMTNEFINTKLFPIVTSLKSDVVPNIKFNVAKCIESLANLLSEENLRKEAIPLLQQLLNDADFDVRYFAEKALQHERIRSFCFQPFHLINSRILSLIRISRYYPLHYYSDKKMKVLFMIREWVERLKENDFQLFLLFRLLLRNRKCFVHLFFAFVWLKQNSWDSFL
eukprot:TRINITY_DN223_c0_g1_i2.p1 TRINITY_DN223_c0_g1~~TRINITY_DN223_c0_g1_i2.p1  ORF type:complete len:631 (+),score=63.48 TRINITY_DN223_c0_g1_i2:2806-4698(+)